MRQQDVSQNIHPPYTMSKHIIEWEKKNCVICFCFIESGKAGEDLIVLCLWAKLFYSAFQSAIQALVSGCMPIHTKRYRYSFLSKGALSVMANYVDG